MTKKEIKSLKARGDRNSKAMKEVNDKLFSSGFLVDKLHFDEITEVRVKKKEIKRVRVTITTTLTTWL